MSSPSHMRLTHLVFVVLILAGSAQGQQPKPDDLKWLSPNDGHLRWLNVADWEQKTGGVQPVRIPKSWRDKIPDRSAARALSTAGVALRLRTDSSKIAIRLTFLDIPEGANVSPEAAWERARPPYFDVYRDGKFLANVPAKIVYYEQDVIVFDDSTEPKKESEFTILFPHYYRNAEAIINGIGLEKDSEVLPPMPRNVPVVLFHGDSITHGHGVTSPRETYVWQTCEMANCEPLNLGFGGSAWTDPSVAEYLVSRKDWDVLVLMLGTNSFGGRDSSGKPETLAQYREKYDAFLGVIRAKFPMKPILCISPILTHEDIIHKKNSNGDVPQDYRNAIQQVVEQRRAKDQNLYFLDGLTLVNDPLYLMVIDQVHPNEGGSLKMAEGIAARLKPIFKDLHVEATGVSK